MTTFSYTSGDPTQLVAGNTADMSDISGPFDDVKTFLNGSIDTANLATSAKPVTLLGQYRTVVYAKAPFTDAATTGTRFFIDTGLGVSAAGLTNTPYFIPIDPADYAVSGLTTKFRLRVAVLANATAPGITFTFGLYPLTIAGAADTTAVTLGTVTSGSTVAVATPSASTATLAVGSDFTPPSAGVYIPGVALSGNVAADSGGFLIARLDVHHV